jgi:hypothetical protein
MLRAIPYLHTILSTSMRVSNAKARRQLGWAPAVSTYREGISAGGQGQPLSGLRQGTPAGFTRAGAPDDPLRPWCEAAASTSA